VNFLIHPRLFHFLLCFSSQSGTSMSISETEYAGSHDVLFYMKQSCLAPMLYPYVTSVYMEEVCAELNFREVWYYCHTLLLRKT
jgi:hypothetical protein